MLYEISDWNGKVAIQLHPRPISFILVPFFTVYLGTGASCCSSIHLRVEGLSEISIGIGPWIIVVIVLHSPGISRRLNLAVHTDDVAKAIVIKFGRAGEAILAGAGRRLHSRLLTARLAPASEEHHVVVIVISTDEMMAVGETPNPAAWRS